VVTTKAETLEPILLNDFKRQWADVGGDVLGATQRVGESGWYILGSEVKEFERDLSVYLGRRHVVGCANGLDAIEIGLRALGIQPGERVLTTALSAFATTLAIVRAGGVPVFVDTDEFGLIDLCLVRQSLEKDKTIKFLVPVHLYGHSLNLEELARIKRDFDLRIVEDCCQAIGSKWGDMPVGTVGDIGVLSFYPTKNLGALGDGGCVLTDDEHLAALSRSLRDYGQTSRYHHEVLGLNSRLDELHAAILRTALLPRLPSWTNRRQTIAKAYLNGIHHKQVKVLSAPPGSNSVWHLFPVMVSKVHREHFRAHLARAKVSTAIHYPELISRQAALNTINVESNVAVPQAEGFCEMEVSLPIHPYMTDAEIERVISAVNTWQQP
jgi:dTDP-3-amino-3,4,6-trideoxy-alpha-D-glucose transaminase